MASAQPATQKSKVFGKKWEKIAVKHSIEKPILLNFVKLSTNFYPRLSGEKYFYF